MGKNLVLVDYENVKPTKLELLNSDEFEVIVFIGSNQTKVDIDFALALQQLGNKARYVKISGNGKNALDFHIAFYIGKISEIDKSTYFHIISKDCGFDPLIEYLNGNNVRCSRSIDIISMPCMEVATGLTKAVNSVVSSPSSGKKVTQKLIQEERIKSVVGDLIRKGNSKPRKITTLYNSLNSMFLKKLDENQLNKIISVLKQKNLININDNKVTYDLPSLMKFKVANNV